MNPLEHVEAIKASITRVDPAAVEREVAYLIGARVQAWAASPTFGARSCDEPPMLLPDKVDRWTQRKHREYRDALRRAAVALGHAVALQDELLVRLTLEEAQRAVEQEAGDDAQTCANRACQCVTRRVIGGRCPPCYEYRRRHDGVDAPAAVIERRIAQ